MPFALTPARLTLLLTGGYAVLGLLGMALMSPLDFASPIYPAAGLALAFMLRFGPRATIAGMWLGAFLTQVLFALFESSLNANTFWMAALTGVGVCAQAWVGHALITRLMGERWRTLENETDTLAFMALGGVLAGLTGSAIATASRWLLGLIEPSQALRLAGDWYLGDMLGIVLFAPLTLCFLMGRTGSWPERRRRIAAPILITLGLAFALFRFMDQLDEKSTQHQLAVDGQLIAHGVAATMARHQDLLMAVRNFMESNPAASFEQFQHFTRHILADNPSVSALSFNDYVSRDQREHYEALMSRQSPLGRFQITERDDRQQLVRAASRPHHVVVRYITPLEGNRPAIGFDIASEPVRRQAIDQAVALSRMTVTAPLKLMQDQTPHIGLLELLPAYSSSATPGTERRPLGFAVAVLKMSDLITAATRDITPAGLVFQLKDLDAIPGQDTVYRSDHASTETLSWTPRSTSWTQTLAVGGRHWELSVTPTLRYNAHSRAWRAWAVGVLSLLFSTLLQVLLLGMTGRTAVIERKNQELAASENRYAELFNSSPLPMWLYDTTTLRFLMVNDRAVEHYGWPRESLLRMRLPDLLAPEAAAAYLHADPAAHHEPLGLETRHRLRDGTVIEVRVNSSPVQHMGAAARLEVVQDVTRQNRDQVRLLLADKAFANTGEGIVITDARGMVISVNPAFTRVTGYSPEEIVGSNMRKLKSGRQNEAFYEQMWHEIATHQQWRGEIWNRRKNGEIYAEWLTITAVLDKSGAVTNYLAAFSDITEHKKAREQIDYLAFHDALTGLPNRVLGQHHVQQSIAIAQRHPARMAILYLDLDKFKYINDTHGHTTGDALLRSVARRLASCIRAEDTLCRLSGDEFMVVLHDVADQRHVSIVCDKILDQLAQPFELEGVQLNTSFSIGIAMYPQDGTDHETLIRNADTALFEAKQGGRNTYRFFDSQMNANVVRYVKTRDDLLLALEREEFELYYQPQVRLSDGQVIGVEALIRWHRPEQGLVPPIDFIPVAEESGLIVPIGRWVLQQACRQAAAWHAAGWRDLVVAVNLSAVQFRQGRLESDVLTALLDSGLPPGNLELELTESIVMQDVEAVLATVQRLKSHGLQLSIDDFGTGYSSLAYLKRFHVDKLKIDRSFIRDILVDDEDRAIASAIVQMASSLNLETIAEGVDQPEMVAMLQQLGCHEAQGYLFARPMPAAEFEAWMRQKEQAHSGTNAAAADSLGA